MKLNTKRISGLSAITALLGLVVLTAGCDIDPDDDFGTTPPPGPTNPPDPTEPPDPTDPPDPTNPPDPTDPGGAGCLGHCDCPEGQYCAAVGTCQLVVVAGDSYCCSRTESCPTGALCHIEGTAGETDFCP